MGSLRKKNNATSLQPRAYIFLSQRRKNERLFLYAYLILRGGRICAKISPLLCPKKYFLIFIKKFFLKKKLRKMRRSLYLCRRFGF